MPRFAANLSMMFTEYSFLDRFQAAADSGFEAVEYLFPYDFPADAIAGRLEKAALKQALFNMPPGNWNGGDRGLASLPDRREEFHTSVATAISYAQTIRTPLLHMMAGLADAGNDAATVSYREALVYAADRTEEAGIGLVIEPINGRDMPGYFLRDFDRALDFVKELNRPHVRLQFDIYHRQVLHGDVITGLRAMMPYIAHIQTASVPLRNEPGTGELNDAMIFDELDALGYHGFVGCEYRPRSNTRDGLSWMSA